MNNNSLVDPCVGCPIRLNSDGTCGVGCKELQEYVLKEKEEVIMLSIGDKVLVPFGGVMEEGVIEYIPSKDEYCKEDSYGVYVANCVHALYHIKDIIRKV